MIAFFGTKIVIILNNTKDIHKSTYDAKRLRNYSLYNQTPKEEQKRGGVKDSRHRPQVRSNEPGDSSSSTNRISPLHDPIQT